MRRFITLLIPCILALGALSSCNLDKDYSFTYANSVTLHIENPEDNEAVTEYMQTNYVDAPNGKTYYGKHYDAMEVYIDYFIGVTKTVDEEFLAAHLTSPQDFVQLSGFMLSDAGNTWVGSYSWTYEGFHPEYAEGN